MTSEVVALDKPRNVLSYLLLAGGDVTLVAAALYGDDSLDSQAKVIDRFLELSVFNGNMEQAILIWETIKTFYLANKRAEVVLLDSDAKETREWWQTLYSKINPVVHANPGMLEGSSAVNIQVNYGDGNGRSATPYA